VLFLVADRADSAIVNSDTLAGVQIVVDQALIAAASDHRTDLNYREPVDVEIGDQAVAEIQVEVSHIHDLSCD